MEIVITFIVVMAIYIFKNVIKNESNRKQFKQQMKIGDKVYTPTITNSIDGEILEVLEDSVVLKVTVFKSRVYPKSE